VLKKFIALKWSTDIAPFCEFLVALDEAEDVRITRIDTLVMRQWLLFFD